MKITFLGAARTVTGSRYMLEDGNKRILVDCGLFQGQKELRLRNWADFPASAASFDAILLTHAHLDHSGYIPRLVRQGFRGPVYCSAATHDLCRILLPDSGHLQEEDAERANREGYTKHAPALPLYTEEDAAKSLELFRPVPFGKAQRLGEFLEFTLYHAGHILGASFIRVSDGGTSILFSGDLGRPDDPVIHPPAKIQDADYVVVESTYGDRLHDKADPADQLEEIINCTAQRGGTVVIPAFAVGRAQLIMYYIYRLKQEKRISPHIPVYLDSPMAISASDILEKHAADHRLPPALCHAMCDAVQYTPSVAESKAIDEAASRVPSVIISASGMATGGRVLHHLRRFMGDARNTILLAGYQAAGTRGARLARGEKELKFHGQMWPVKAEVVKLDNMSAHADYAEVLDWLGNFTSPPRKVFVTHGEEGPAESLRQKIADRFNWDAVVPEMGQSETL